MSLWADYLTECGILELIEEPWGFVTFEIAGDDLWIGDLYVTPAERLYGRGEDLLARATAAGKERGCLFLCSAVNIKHKDVEGVLSAHFGQGFRVHSAEGEFIFMKRIL